jgi:hypothetical protein
MKSKGDVGAHSFFAPASFSICAISSCPEKVLMSMWVEEPFALLIHNKGIADSFRNYFCVLWNESK